VLAALEMVHLMIIDSSVNIGISLLKKGCYNADQQFNKESFKYFSTKDNEEFWHLWHKILLIKPETK